MSHTLPFKRLIIPQPNMPVSLLRLSGNLKLMAEDLYCQLFHLAYDVDLTERDIVTYVQDSDWLGYREWPSCQCGRCEECHSQGRWLAAAYQILNDVIDNFTPPANLVLPCQYEDHPVMITGYKTLLVIVDKEHTEYFPFRGYPHAGPATRTPRWGGRRVY